MNQETVINLEQQGDITIVDIKGDVTAFSESFFKEAYQKANAQNTKKLLLKFDVDAYINSGGIAVLIQLLAETKRNNQQIAITGLSNHFKKIFGMVGITKFAKIYSSMEEAINEMRN